MTKYLIVNSDDFGISEAVSRGIIEGHHKGIVTSTTTMINMPAAEAAILEAQKSAPELGLGLHFTLSFGEPVSPPESVPSLVTEEGRFVTTFQGLMEKTPHFAPEELIRELTAQFERFRAIAGRLPTHLDSHHGCTYYHPAAFDLMLELGKTHHLPIRWNDSFTSRADPNDANQTVLKQIADSLEKHGTPRKTDYFVDFVFDFERGPRIERMKNGLRTVKDGYTELMVHVGYAEGLDEQYTVQREEELAAVTDAAVKQIISEEGIQLVNFDDLP